MQKIKEEGLFIIVTCLIISVLIAAYYIFYIKEEYAMTVEAPCDSSLQSCFIRDCTNPDDCPANGLTEYRIFDVKASDFETCADGSCLNECITGTIICEEETCGDNTEDTCTTE